MIMIYPYQLALFVLAFSASSKQKYNSKRTNNRSNILTHMAKPIFIQWYQMDALFDIIIVARTSVLDGIQ